MNKIECKTNTNPQNTTPRIRTIPNAYKEIKKIDPDTDFSMRALRKMVNSGEIPTVKISNKVLINLDLLIEKLSCYNNNDTCA